MNLKVRSYLMVIGYTQVTILLTFTLENYSSWLVKIVSGLSRE